MKKILLALLGAVLILSVVSSGCGGASPASMIDNAIQNSNKVKSAHVDFNLALNVQGDSSVLGAQYQGLLPLNLTVDGGADIDMKDQSNPKAQGNVKIGGLDQVINSINQAQGADGQAALGAGLIGGALSDLQFVLLNNDVFLKISGNWYETGNLSSAASQYGINLQTPTTPSSSDCFTNAFKDTSKFGADKVLKDLQETGTESIDGTNTHHITGNINFDSLLTQVANTSRDCGDAQAAGGIEAAKGQIGAIFKTASVEVWISDDNYIRQAKINLTLDPSTIAGLLSSLGGTSDSGTSDQLKAIQSVGLNATIKQSRFNEDFNISKPEGNIQNLQDLIGATGLGGLGGLGGSSGSTSALPGLDGSAGLYPQ